MTGFRLQAETEKRRVVAVAVCTQIVSYGRELGHFA